MDQEILPTIRCFANKKPEALQLAWGRTLSWRYAVKKIGITVTNRVDSSYQIPSLWIWDSADVRWEDGASTAIARGADFDLNAILQPEYDNQNRILQTRDSRGNLTRFVYDAADRQIMTISNYTSQANEPEEWVWSVVNQRWEDGAGTPIDYGVNNDLNIIDHTAFDILGQVVTHRDAAGRENRTIYDGLGRTVKTIVNYMAQVNPPEAWEWVNNRWEDGFGGAIQHDVDNDRNIISETVYNRAGQVISTRDTRGTQTDLDYDGAGRMLSLTQAAGTPFSSTIYTCYDKVGRVLRTIQGYITQYTDQNLPLLPDVWLGASTWLFMPEEHGTHNDTNLITVYGYDRASRLIITSNPAGDSTQTTYFIDGQIDGTIDPEGTLTVYRYDGLNRRVLVVQNYISNSEDPATWVWDTGNSRYEESNGTPIEHGTDNDQNIIVRINYDLSGRITQQRDPRGNVTSYIYDQLGRRTQKTNPLSEGWVTTYTEAAQSQRITQAFPGINGGSAYDVARDFDRLGRLIEIDYNDAISTPKIGFTYDLLGSRLSMVENDGTLNIRRTLYSYDAVSRLSVVGFDNDGSGVVDETVSYSYDLGGLKTRLSLPGNLNIVYVYDQQGQLVSLSDWDGQVTTFNYDLASRHIVTRRANGMRSIHAHDSAGRLRTLRHENEHRATLAEFRYQVDGRGNRTRTREVQLSPGAIPNLPVVDYNDSTIQTRGTWDEVSGFYETTAWDATLSFAFVGNVNVELEMGEGPDHSIYDIYIDGTLWRSLDGYALSSAARIIQIVLDGDGLRYIVRGGITWRMTPNDLPPWEMGINKRSAGSKPVCLKRSYMTCARSCVSYRDVKNSRKYGATNIHSSSLTSLGYAFLFILPVYQLIA